VLFVDLAVGDGVLKERGQRERARSRRRRLGRGRRRARAEPEPTEEGELRDELVAEFLRVLAVARDHAFEAGFERALLLRDRRFALRELLLDRREALDPRLVLARERLLLLGLLLVEVRLQARDLLVEQAPLALGVGDLPLDLLLPCGDAALDFLLGELLDVLLDEAAHAGALRRQLGDVGTEREQRSEERRVGKECRSRGWR